MVASQVFFSAASLTAQMPELWYGCTFDLTDAKLRSVKQIHCKLSPTGHDQPQEKTKRETKT